MNISLSVISANYGLISYHFGSNEQDGGLFPGDAEKSKTGSCQMSEGLPQQS